jgi:hypothetical protein
MSGCVRIKVAQSREVKRFFFKKKNQKTFAHRASAWPGESRAVRRSLISAHRRATTAEVIERTMNGPPSPLQQP